MDEYDPLIAPDAEEWLEADEFERLQMVEDWHRRARIKLPNATVHATIHAVVENQLAESVPEVVDALERMSAEGLDRHDAIHAIGSVLAEHMFNALTADAGSDIGDAYLRDLKDLTAEKWLSLSE